MKKWLFIFVLALFPFCQVPMAAQDCPIGAIVGPGSLFYQVIDCGDGHDCRAPVCGAGFGTCCETTGGYVHCTYCDEYFCSLFTVSCA